MKKINENDYKVPAFLRRKSINDKLRKPIRRKRRASTVSSNPLEFPNCNTYPSSQISDSKISSYPQPAYFNPITNTPINTDKPSDFKKWVLLGTIEYYFEKINVIAFTTEYPLRVGDRILIENNDGMFEQTITSMQIDKEDIRYADQGSDIGLKVLLPTYVSAKVFKEI